MTLVLGRRRIFLTLNLLENGRDKTVFFVVDGLLGEGLRLPFGELEGSLGRLQHVAIHERRLLTFILVSISQIL